MKRVRVSTALMLLTPFLMQSLCGMVSENKQYRRHLKAQIKEMTEQNDPKNIHKLIALTKKLQNTYDAQGTQDHLTHIAELNTKITALQQQKTAYIQQLKSAKAQEKKEAAEKKDDSLEALSLLVAQEQEIAASEQAASSGYCAVM